MSKETKKRAVKNLSPVKDQGKLTDKQEQFCQSYVLNNGNGTQAAIQAGYSKDTAHAIAWENLRKPEIEKRIQEIRDSLPIRTGVTIEYVLGGLVENFERSMQHREVTTKEGEPTGVYAWNASAANKSLDMMGRYLGMFKDKLEHSADETLIEALRDIAEGVKRDQQIEEDPELGGMVR